jgi:hypothetical protein
MKPQFYTPGELVHEFRGPFTAEQIGHLHKCGLIDGTHNGRYTIVDKSSYDLLLDFWKIIQDEESLKDLIQYIEGRKPKT